MKINIVQNMANDTYSWVLRSRNGQFMARSAPYARQMGAVRAAKKLIEACKPGAITFVEGKK